MLSPLHPRLKKTNKCSFPSTDMQQVWSQLCLQTVWAPPQLVQGVPGRCPRASNWNSIWWLQQKTDADACTIRWGNRILPNPKEEGYVFTCRQGAWYTIRNTSDQEFVCNVTKFVNLFLHASRVIYVGRYMVYEPASASEKRISSREARFDWGGSSPRQAKLRELWETRGPGALTLCLVTC